MNETVIAKASTTAHVLNAKTQAVLDSQQSKDRRFRFWCYFSLSIVLLLLVLSIYRQNQIAYANKTHIDCIVKLLATPQKPGTTHKFISDASQTCNIKFN